MPTLAEDVQTAQPTAGRSVFGPALYGLTVLFGAFLLFAVEPLIGKYILPWFGGSPEVWTTCMLFFQVMLLVGYLYAHVLARLLGPRGQALVHVLMLAGAAAMLPIIPGAAWAPTGHEAPVLRILLMLLACLGLPYMVLSATGPLLQHWFSLSEPKRSPYVLYAISNAGSFAALLSYPFLFEPHMGRVVQADVWSVGMVGFAVLCSVCALRLGIMRRGWMHSAPAVAAAQPIEPRPTAGRVALWIVLPAAASMLLLATTNKITQDIAAVPFLWVLPLSLYLLTFVICFSGEKAFNRRTFNIAYLIALAGVLGVRLAGPNLGLLWQVCAYLAAMFIGAMLCHGEVYRLRPGAGRLTSYYLAISLGGAIGGVFVAVVAPMVFNSYAELALSMALAWAVALVAGGKGLLGEGWQRWVLTAGLAAFALAANTFGEGMATMRTVEQGRNFFGVLTVKEADGPDGRPAARLMRHGNTFHGAQFLDPRMRGLPTAYYAQTSGVGRAMACLSEGPRRVGLVGLGAGTLAAYGRPGDVFRFYEINPAVIDAAHKWFYYLGDSKAKIEIVLGDARLSMQREQPQQYDMLVLDAFTSDSIPVHLLTVEAFQLYRSHLRPGGIIAAHVSNRHLNLVPIVSKIGQHMGMSVVEVDDGEHVNSITLGSDWVLMSDDAERLKDPRIGGLVEGYGLEDYTLWTDDRTSLLQVLK